MSTLHAAPPSPAWAQAAADAAAEVSHGGQAPLTLPDGTPAVLMPAALRDHLEGSQETLDILRSRRSRTRLVRGLSDLTAGRAHDNRAAADALARHPGRPRT